MRIKTQDILSTEKKQYLTMQRNMALNTLVKNNGSNLNVCNHATPSETIGAIEKCNITIEWNNTNVSDIPVWKALDFSAALYHSTETSIIYGGVEIPNEDLPIFDLSDCKEVKAIDNYIYFEKGQYYKSTNDDGQTYVMSCQPGLGQPYSQILKEGLNEDANKAGSFWWALSLGRSVSFFYSYEEIRSYLEKADVKPGFFTVNIAGKSVEYYYSPDGTGYTSSVMLLTRAEYNIQYSLLTNEGGKHTAFHDILIGSVFEIDGKEYVMDENYSLNIPYGIDLTKIKYPKSIYALEKNGDS